MKLINVTAFLMKSNKIKSGRKLETLTVLKAFKHWIISLNKTTKKAEMPLGQHGNGLPLPIIRSISYLRFATMTEIFITFQMLLPF